MRSLSWTAHLLPLLALLCSPAAARERPAARVLQQRTAYWAPGSTPVELHVAPGVATTVRLQAFPELRSLELTEGRSPPRLHPLGGSSFSISPPGDFAVGERALVTVRLGTPEVPLSLLLVSREDRVDGEVRLVRLRAPTPGELDVEAVARLLSATPQEGVSLAEEGPMLQGAKIRIQVESTLRLGSRMFVTLVGYPVGKSRTPWRLERARLRVLLEGGSQVEVPLLPISSPSKGAQQQRHTFVAPLPARFLRLFLTVEGEGAPEGFFPLPSSEATPSP